MVDIIQTAQNYEELLQLSSHEMPYKFENLFSTESRSVRSASKKRFELLKQIDTQVRKMLEPDEKVLFLTSAVEISGAETFLVGAIWLQFINRRALIFTNKRILLLQINYKNRPHHIKSQIRFPSIKKVGGTLGSLKIKFEKGKPLSFSNMQRSDVKFIKQLLEDFTKKEAIAPPELKTKAKENLCPYCYTAVEGFPEQCASCFKMFKSPSKAARLSLLFPGIGDLYLGHKALGVFELIAATGIWAAWLVPLFAESFNMASFITTVVGVFLVMHGLDALGTWFIAKKGLIPAE